VVQAVRGQRAPKIGTAAAKVLAEMSPAGLEMDEALLASQLEAKRLRQAYSQVETVSEIRVNFP